MSHSTPLIAGGFGTPDSNDRRPWLWVASIVSLSYGIMTMLVRIFAKWGLLGVEDYLLAPAYIFAIASWGLFFRATLDGLGATHANSPQAASDLFFKSEVMLLITIYLVKCSVIWFARKIFVGTKLESRMIFNSAMGFTAVCGVASVALFAAACDFPLALSQPTTKCSSPSMTTRQTVLQVLDAITEILVVALPTYFVSRNSIALSNKVTVIVLFAFRLPCVCFMGASATSFKFIVQGHVSPTNAAAPAAIWAQVLLGYSLSSASIPCIRSFLHAFLVDGLYRIQDTSTNRSRTGYGGGYGLNSEARHARPGASYSQAHKHSNTFGVASGADIKTNVQAGDVESMASDNSQRMIIERSVEVEMTIEQAAQQASSSREALGRAGVAR